MQADESTSEENMRTPTRREKELRIVRIAIICQGSLCLEKL
jgi:hypothetical protein